MFGSTHVRLVLTTSWLFLALFGARRKTARYEIGQPRYLSGCLFKWNQCSSERTFSKVDLFPNHQARSSWNGASSLDENFTMDDGATAFPTSLAHLRLEFTVFLDV
jgi:hypothetical protein